MTTNFYFTARKGSGKVVAAATASAAVDFSGVSADSDNAIIVNNTTGYSAYIVVNQGSQGAATATAAGHFIPGNAENLVIPVGVGKIVSIAAIRNAGTDTSLHIQTGRIQDGVILA